MTKSMLRNAVLSVLAIAMCLVAQESPDSSVAHKVGFKGFPYVYYTPETELAAGIGGILTFYTGKERILRPSKASVSGYYATTGQYKFSLVPQFYFSSNRYFASAALDFGNYVDRFYGVGDDTPDIDNSQYVSQAFGAELVFEMPPLLQRFTTRTGVIYDFQNNTITDKKDNPYLNSGEVRGSEGGLTSGLGLAWVWDNRDHSFFPNKGGLHRVKAVFYFSEFGSDFEYNKYEVDLRQYFAVAPDHVFAFQAYGSFARNTPPFYELPALGGQNRMRGYFQGRFRDRNYVAAQVEYRAYLWWRLGAVAFFGLGDVNEHFKKFDIGNFKRSYGVGLRVKFNQAEKVNLRIDYGRGKDTGGIYFGLEEAF